MAELSVFFYGNGQHNGCKRSVAAHFLDFLASLRVAQLQMKPEALLPVFWSNPEMPLA
ncbi:hypothetical protein [uncultured Paenibacillus sp.]|uniref:hypothetical protein n=1 Tax=uncultured Paenibacillus sp. TaxID=227322 RepID=UPI0013E31755|nr:hypothetical protein [uncultured Paenibacillus sp.]